MEYYARVTLTLTSVDLGRWRMGEKRRETETLAPFEKN